MLIIFIIRVKFSPKMREKNFVELYLFF
jgi:hypothetical protein